MPAKTKTESDGFSAEERAAMKQRAAELRAEGRKGAKKADALQATLDSIAAMTPDDRALAERVHATVTSTAAELSPKTWYGMPAYANEDGKVVVFFKDAGKFKSRYATLGFEEAANLDDGPMWPTSYRAHGVDPGGREEDRRAGEGSRLVAHTIASCAVRTRRGLRLRRPCLRRHNDHGLGGRRNRTRGPSGHHGSGRTRRHPCGRSRSWACILTRESRHICRGRARTRLRRVPRRVRSLLMEIACGG